ncbi:MAG: PTS sugar transporter subunit IIC [Candidatus Eisenbacteria bacterium]|nr:PTS sugar transporter subunit IIC [Candidatus Eisenbacteria bacterium]
MAEILKIIIAGGISSLDSTAAWQVMISQPLVNAVVTGLILGDVTTGAVLGTLFQIVWGGSLPVGASAFPDGATAGVIGTGGAILLKKNLPGIDGNAVLLWSLLISLGFGIIGARTVIYMRRMNESLMRRADEFAREGKVASLELLHLVGVVVSFVRGILVTASGLLVLLISGLAVLPKLGSTLSPAFQPVQIVIWSMGISIFCAIFVRKKSRIVPFVLGLVFAACLAWGHLL